MTGFKLRTSGIGSDHSTIWATTTSFFFFLPLFTIPYLEPSPVRKTVSLSLSVSFSKLPSFFLYYFGTFYNSVSTLRSLFQQQPFIDFSIVQCTSMFFFVLSFLFFILLFTNPQILPNHFRLVKQWNAQSGNFFLFPTQIRLSST